jgi:hypothetical protein
MPRLRLRKQVKLHAVQFVKGLDLSADDSFVRNALRTEANNVGIDPALIALFISIGMAIFRYFRDRDVSDVSVESDETILRKSAQYQE